jgi:hypothetical protein
MTYCSTQISYTNKHIIKLKNEAFVRTEINTTGYTTWEIDETKGDGRTQNCGG